MPLYVFCGDHLLTAKLRTLDRDAAKGSKEELERLVTEIRKRWPEVKIIVRADSGFCRDDFMTWCEDNDVKYILGIARNNRLVKMLKGSLGNSLEYLETNCRQKKERQESILSFYINQLKLG